MYQGCAISRRLLILPIWKPLIYRCFSPKTARNCTESTNTATTVPCLQSAMAASALHVPTGAWHAVDRRRRTRRVRRTKEAYAPTLDNRCFSVGHQHDAPCSGMAIHVGAARQPVQPNAAHRPHAHRPVCMTMQSLRGTRRDYSAVPPQPVVAVRRCC